MIGDFIIHFRYKNGVKSKENIRIVSISKCIDSEIKNNKLIYRYTTVAGIQEKYLKNDVIYDSSKCNTEERFLVCRVDKPREFGDFYKLGRNCLIRFTEFLKENNINI